MIMLIVEKHLDTIYIGLLSSHFSSMEEVIGQHAIGKTWYCGWEPYSPYDSFKIDWSRTQTVLRAAIEFILGVVGGMTMHLCQMTRGADARETAVFAVAVESHILGKNGCWNGVLLADKLSRNIKHGNRVKEMDHTEEQTDIDQSVDPSWDRQIRALIRTDNEYI
jgi:hypothetical protein